MIFFQLFTLPRYTDLDQPVTLWFFTACAVVACGAFGAIFFFALYMLFFLHYQQSDYKHWKTAFRISMDYIFIAVNCFAVDSVLKMDPMNLTMVGTMAIFVFCLNFLQVILLKSMKLKLK